MFRKLLESFRSHQEVEATSFNQELNFNVCRVRRPDGSDGFVDILTVLSPEAFLKHGIPEGAIAGFFTELVAEGEKLNPASFRPNQRFIKLLHEVIATNAPSIPELQLAARQQHTGSVSILDGRTPTPQGTVPPRDIIGAFAVKDGAIVPDSYFANPNYLLFSLDGFLKIDKSLQNALIARVMNSATQDA
jgi:hypothetical protein